MRDYTLDTYRALLDHLTTLGYTTCRVVDAVRAQPESSTPRVILRHDVERQPGRALALARLEVELGHRSTFYVRMHERQFPRDLVHALGALGHEVGYHYETLGRTGGKLAAAVELFQRELACLREHATVHTATAHGRPLSSHNSMGIWQAFSPAAVDLTEGNLHFERYPDLVYVNDTGRSWGNRHNLRDRVRGRTVDALTDTASLMAYVEREHPVWLYLQVHPHRWVGSTSAWAVQYGVDQGVNLLKSAIRLLRGPDAGTQD